MALSGFAHSANLEAAKGSPWIVDWTPGPALTNLFNLYPSKGNMTIAAATNLPSLLDGPITVARYGALTVNAALSVTNRCRGLLLLCDSLTMGAAGSISMTARGAVGNSKWANQDILLPTNMRLSGQKTSYRDFVGWCAANGYAIFDPTLFACPLPGMGDVQANYTSWPGNGTAIISAAGCGAGGAPMFVTQSYANGYTGIAGTVGGTGGGGAGGVAYNGASVSGAPGCVWGGGSGSSGVAQGGSKLGPDQYGGKGGSSGVNFGDGTYNASGGGAGNPGGDGSTATYKGSDGTGGVLIVICRGNVTIASGALLYSNGSQGGSTTGSNTNASGSGSGAGSVSLFYGGTLTNSGSLTASGGGYGMGGVNTAYGGSGGVGSTQAKTFAQMGWN